MKNQITEENVNRTIDRISDLIDDTQIQVSDKAKETLDSLYEYLNEKMKEIAKKYNKT